MEHISNILPQVENGLQSQQEPKTLPEALERILEPQDLKVLSLKYKSPTVGKLTDIELLFHGKALLLKIHVVTGWTIPSSDELMNILVDQFVKILVEKYATLNTDEIEYAFRESGTTIQDWGKEMNLSLIDSCLIPYMNKRFEISSIERRLKEPPPPQKIFTPEELDNAAREDAERNYQSFLRGQELKGLEFNKAILEKDGILKEGETVMDVFLRRANKLAPNIYRRDGI